MKKFLNITTIAILFFAFSFPPKKNIKVYLIGDSTMCEYEMSRAPLTGWGMPFKYFFDSTVQIDNRQEAAEVQEHLLAKTVGNPLPIVCMAVIMY